MKNQRSRHLDAKSPTTASSNTCHTNLMGNMEAHGILRHGPWFTLPACEPLRSNALATFCSARWPNFTSDLDAKSPIYIDTRSQVTLRDCFRALSSMVSALRS